jgi:NAD(P)-dependent dehydrogenase (short-subunit alcohol dehydrogenase family)
MNDGPVVLITSATQYVGPASVSRLSRSGARIVAQDAAFSDLSLRRSFIADRPGITACDLTEPDDIVAAALAAQDLKR